MAHTRGHNVIKSWINMHLKTPDQVTEVIVMARYDGTISTLKRLNNTVIETTDESNITKECGKVILKEYKPSTIVRVTCKEVRRVVNVTIIASKPAFSINIAELRICQCTFPCRSKHLKLTIYK